MNEPDTLIRAPRAAAPAVAPANTDTFRPPDGDWAVPPGATYTPARAGERPPSPWWRHWFVAWILVGAPAAFLALLPSLVIAFGVLAVNDANGASPDAADQATKSIGSLITWVIQVWLWFQLRSRYDDPKLMRWVRWPNLVQYGGIAIVCAAIALALIASGKVMAAVPLGLIAAPFGWITYRFWRWRFPVAVAH